MASSKTRTYKYESLYTDILTKQIRLMQIVYDGRAQLACRIQRFTLAGNEILVRDPVPRSPAFVAMSCEWKLETGTVKIEVNGHDFAVSRNVHEFLLAIRRGLDVFAFLPAFEEENAHVSRALGANRKDIWLWCDQICIDQEDPHEKGHQVAIMDEIYTAASEILAWVGTEQINVRRVTARDCSSQDDVRTLVRDALLQANYSNSLGLLQPMVWREVEQMLQLFAKQTYWSRVWIVQEILLSQNVSLVCGGMLVDWPSLDLMTKSKQDGTTDHRPAFRRLPRVIMALDATLQAKGPSMHALVEAKRNFSGPREPLSYVIQTFGDLGSKDVRDRVYGLLGLVHRSRRITVDYNLDAVDVLFEVMARIAKWEPDLEDEDQEHFAIKLRKLLHLTKEDISEEELIQYMERQLTFSQLYDPHEEPHMREVNIKYVRQ